LRVQRIGAIACALVLAAMLVACSTGLRLPGQRSAFDASARQNSCGSIHAVGSQLIDAQGQPVVLTGVNWFGFETQSFAPEGLNVRNYQSMLDQMAQLGFNTLRLPYSNQLFDPASRPASINYVLNPDLRGLQGLGLMDRIIAGARKAGLCVILDQHRPDAYA